MALDLNTVLALQSQAKSLATTGQAVSSLEGQLALAQGHKAALDSAASTLRREVPAVQALQAKRARIAALQTQLARAKGGA